MNCENCGHDNPSASVSCRSCGRPFHAVPPTARRHAERRQVTVLFCDLVDSVPLSVRLDPEDMMHVFDTYLATCDDIIAEFGGNVMQYMGDGVLAYFGYPRANEDDAANAVRAGMALCDAVARLELPRQVSLQARIGIATGFVVVSDLIGHREGRGGGIIGETPNLAARLQSVAQPGTVVVADATRRVAGRQFAYRGLGAFPLKGFPAPVEAYQVVEALPLASRYLARSPGKAIPLVGRDDELGLMLDCWAAARAGRSRIVLLRGEPGIGKSRLVEELRAHAADTPHVEVTWSCGPNFTRSALHPITEQLARAAAFERGDSADVRRDKLGGLLAQYGATEAASKAVLADMLGIPAASDTPIETMRPYRRKQVILDTLLGMLDRWARLKPALLILEDAHWADPTTLELTERVIRELGERPGLILVTARPDYEPPWLDHPDVACVQLDRLDRDHAERICTSLGAGDLLSESTMRQIVARCDGIPLFLEEMTKSVLEATAAVPARDGLRSVAIPVSVQDSLVARLDRLGPARRIANLGAAIGRRFSYELLAAVAAEPEPALRQSLRDLTLSGLVDSDGLPPASSYLFKHALIRDAAHESLLKRERTDLHGRIAAVLRDRFPQTLEAEPELLAYHLTESGAFAEAIPFWAKAGRRAGGRAAHVEAVAHFQTALDLLPGQPEDRKRAELELQLRLEHIANLSAARGYSAPEVAEALAAARAVCDVLGTFDGLFKLLRNVYLFSVSAGDLAAAEDAARRCIDASEASGLLEQRIEAACALGAVLMSRGDFAGARSLFEQAMRLYTENDGVRLPYAIPHDPFAVYQVFLAEVLRAAGDPEGAEAAIGRALSHARSLHAPYTLALTTTYVACFYNRAGDYNRTLEHAREAVELCGKHGFDFVGVLARNMNAYALGNLGQPQEGLKIALASLAAQDRHGVRYKRCEALGDIARLYAAAGEMQQALRTIDAAIADARQYGDCHFLSQLYRRRAEILERMPGSDPGEVRLALREAISVAREQGAIGFVQQAEAMLARRKVESPPGQRLIISRPAGQLVMCITAGIRPAGASSVQRGG